jgi:hypothetical protein
VAAVLVAAAGAHSSIGQTPPPEAVEPLEKTAARYVTRLALSDLRIVNTPAPRDYQIAADLLERAHGLTPDDDVQLRQLIEACENAGDTARMAKYTRELVRLDPSDTVAQLRLISGKIRELQNVDDRLATYDRWLGPDGASVDPAVRSRLALDAALLAREKGDAKGFARRLGRALELDATNKDAATMALAFYSQKVGEPAGQFELMLAVLNADPFDVDLHRAMAKHLAEHGAYRGAARFYGSMNMLLQRLDGPDGQSNEEDGANLQVVRWCTEGPRAVVEGMNRTVFETRQGYRRQRQEAEAAKQPVDKIPTPESIRLPMPTEWVRLAAAAALADPQLVDGALDEFVESALQESKHLSHPEEWAEWEEKLTPEEATARIRGLLEETTFARLLTARQPEKVEESLDILRADPTVDRDRLSNLEAWNLLRKGEIEGSEQRFKPLAKDNVLAAIGLATISDIKGDKAGATAAYAEIANREAGSIPGAFARTRCEILSGKPLPLDPVAKRLEDLAAGVPSWLDTYVGDPRRMQTVEATLEKGDVRPLDPVRMKITVRNVGPVPMGVGADGPISSRFLIAPSVQVSTISIPTSEFLQVVSLDRRLRLGSQESFSAVVEAEVAPLSLLLEEIGGAMSRARFRVLQGFGVDLSNKQSYSYREGPFSVASDCGPLRREMPPKSTVDPVSLVGFAEKGSPRDIAEAVLIVRGKALPFMKGGKLTAEEQRQFLAAVAKRLPELAPAAQLLVVSVSPPTVQMPDASVIDDAARKLTDPNVRAMYIVMRAMNSSDPVFADSVTQGNPELARLAELVKARLDAGVISYATYKPQSQTPSTAEPTASPGPDK